MKNNTGSLVTGLLLIVCGGVIFYNFLVILAWGRIYPMPNFQTFVAIQVVVFAILGWAGWQLVKNKRGILLFGSAGGLLFAYVVSPWAWVISGQAISSYYGHEPNTIVALVELFIGAAIIASGVFAVIKKPASF